MILLPHQLFQKSLLLDSKITLVEEPKFFTEFRYNKNKLVYHRATMKKYASDLKGFDVTYIEVKNFKKWFATRPKQQMFDPLDHELEKKYSFATIVESPMFMAPRSELKFTKLTHVSFYRWQRRRLNVLMKNDQPIGKWTYDVENRLPLRDAKIEEPHILRSAWIDEAKKYVNKNWPANYGEPHIIFPIDRSSSLRWLKRFVDERLKSFGPYEDAVNSKHLLLYHSGLSPMMNIGLITDRDVIDAALSKKNIPIASMEGFIRQVIGWRNYMYAHYVLNGKKMVKMNFFGNRGKIGDEWWTATVGIEPIDNLIHKIAKYGYVHHIERLMFLGSYLLMKGASPHEVYRIFMEWTIDSYEWVMVPNIYGMSQFADGGIVMKRPYISSSNYILRMSDFKRGAWCSRWDELFRAFINKHKSYFKKTIYSKLIE